LICTTVSTQYHESDGRTDRPNSHIDIARACAVVTRRCRHRALIGACVSALSERMDDVAASTEWETEWLSLDREQLVEFIRSSELTVKDEWDLWQVCPVVSADQKAY